VLKKRTPQVLPQCARLPEALKTETEETGSWLPPAEVALKAVMEQHAQLLSPMDVQGLIWNGG
jgi:hypothetical protein